jgi:GNAT superfamily N-acetyltransferase
MTCAGRFRFQSIISCFVAEVESEIVGIALYYYRYSTWKENNPSGRFSSKTKMRGTGLGYALYSEIIKQARGTMYLELIGMSLIGIPQRSIL